LVVRSLPRRFRPKLLTTEHITWSGYPPLTRLGNAATFWMDDGHLAVSSAVRQSIPAPYRKNVKALIHGVPVTQVREMAPQREAVRSELGVVPGEVLIGTIAQLREQKGYRYLLRAARRVIDSAAQVRFVAVGG